MSFGIYMFCRATNEKTPKCAIKKAYSSKTKAKAHSYSTLGPEHQHGKGPGPPKSPPGEGSVGRCQPGCDPTPLDASRAHSSGGGAFNAPRMVACGAYQKYCTKPSYSSYIRRPPPHSMKEHTLWRRIRRATHIPLASS